MKFFKYGVLLLLPLLLLSACSSQPPNLTLERDNYLTGGVLSFEYSQPAKTAYFGQEGQVVQFYETDVAKGWEEEGNRVGIKIVFPFIIEELSSLTIKVGKEEFQGESLAVKIQDKASFIQVFPLVKYAGEKIKLVVDYKDKKQTIFVQIDDSVILMQNPSLA